MRHRLWKSVDNFSGFYRPEAGLDLLPATFCVAPGDGGSAQPVNACSACAGDYEDPDRTAGGEEENDASEVDDEFPAEEE
jgi:hypothetical protein